MVGWGRGSTRSLFAGRCEEVAGRASRYLRTRRLRTGLYKALNTPYCNPLTTHAPVATAHRRSPTKYNGTNESNIDRERSTMCPAVLNQVARIQICSYALRLVCCMAVSEAEQLRRAEGEGQAGRRAEGEGEEAALREGGDAAWDAAWDAAA